MEEVWHALTDALFPSVEDRYGRAAAWLTAGLLVALPVVGVVGVVACAVTG